MGNDRVQHHLYLRRYSDECIWVCVQCHAEIHANPAWAYEHGYLIHHNGLKIMKKPKTKKCAHTVSYFDRNLGYIKCQFCGQRVEDVKMGKSKKAEPYKKSPAKKSSGGHDKKQANTKMGWEQQDPRIGQAEKLKRERTALEVKLKKEKDPAKHAELETTLGHIVSEMRELQKTYED